jgi:hypothetical protein
MSIRTSVLALAVGLLSPAIAAAHPRAGHNLRSSLAPDRAPARQTAETLLYYGGVVVPNAKVYSIWWGGKAANATDITLDPGGIDSFFEGVTDSLYFDALAQYRTDLTTQVGANVGKPGTGQLIGRGNYAGEYELTQVPAGNVTDAQVQAALEAAITAGTLPPNGPNSIYSIFFPSAVKITFEGVGGGSSCQSFGAYHDITTSLGAIYLVIPNCNYAFTEYCSVASHELSEAVTDVQPTPGSHPDYPQAWNDSMGNEIADICEFSGGKNLQTASGIFAVQYNWDQRANTCDITNHATDDFSIAISPHAWHLQVGSPATLSVQTALVAGAMHPLALKVTAPAGVTATLGASTLMPGESTTLTVRASAPLFDQQVVVTATFTAGATVWTHTAALLVNAVAATDDFSIAVAPPSQEVTQGDPTTYTVTTTSIRGAVPQISLSTAGLPVQALATFSPSSVAAGGTSTLTLKTPRAMPAGTFTFQIVGAADVTRTANATLVVDAIPEVDAGTSDAGSPDAGTPDGGRNPDGGVTGSATAEGGCTQAPIETIGLSLLLCLFFARTRRERA